MGMTRRDYETIARGLEQALNDAMVFGEEKGVISAAESIADALYQASPVDYKGNRTFKVDRFLEAAGLGRERVR